MITQLKRLIKIHIFQKIWNNRGVFPYFQHQVHFPKGSIIFKRAVIEGIYEQENLTIITTLMQDNSTILDIGANIGLMAIPTLSSPKNIKVISVEPSPNSFPFLSKSHNKSRFIDRWELINKAVSNQEGKINFQLANPNDAAYESILNTERVEFIDSVEVECTTIDKIWLERKQPQISFIKIDIEGADLLALRGGLECIRKCKPKVLIEWNKANIIPFNISNIDLLNFTKNINYKIFALPYFNRCESVSDLETLYQFDENFLLVPND